MAALYVRLYGLC